MALTKIDDRGLKTPIDLLDDEKIRFGTGNDLSIYHSGGNNYIDGNSTAEDPIYIRANVGADHSSNIHLQAKSGEDSLVCMDDEAVGLYYDGTQKFKIVVVIEFDIPTTVALNTCFPSTIIKII